MACLLHERGDRESNTERGYVSSGHRPGRLCGGKVKGLYEQAIKKARKQNWRILRRIGCGVGEVREQRRAEPEVAGREVEQ